MSRQGSDVRPLNVLVATPGGGTGQGGIDRIMAALRGEIAQQAPSDMTVRFRATRGGGRAIASALPLAGFCAAMAHGRLRGRLDLVHINLASYGSTYRKLVIAATARALGIPYVLHLHGAEYRAFWSERDTGLNRAIRAMFSGAARIVVLGSPWRAFVTERAPEAAGRIVTIANAVAPPRLASVGGGESVHILFLGRIEPRKGVPQLLDALTAMRDRPGWRATLAGDGAIDDLRGEIEARGLAQRVSVPGWVDGEAVAQLLATGDILTLPSFAENLPMSVIEAMAGGLGVVATPVGAVEDIIKDGETGLLVPPGDVAALTAALTRLIDDADLRRRLGAAAKALHRRSLTIGPYTERMLRLWREVATGTAPFANGA